MRSVKLPDLRSLIVSGGLILALCLSAFDLFPIVSRAQSEEAALRSVVESYFIAYGKKDAAGVVALWSEKSPNLATYRQKLQQQLTIEDLSFGGPAISRVKVENEKAGLRVTIACTAVNLKSNQKSHERMTRTFELVKEAGEWKVWRYAPAAEDLAEALAKAGGKTDREALLAEERELVTVELGQALLAQARQLYNRGSRDRASQMYELALEIAERCDDQSTMARALLNIGSGHWSKGNYAEALEQYQRGLKISETIGDKTGMTRTLNNIGVVYKSQGNYTQALEQYQRGMKIAEETGDRHGVAAALNNIGIVYRLQADYTQALEQYQKSLKISEEIGDRPVLANTLNNIGIVQKLQGNYAQSLEHCQKSLKIFEELGDKIGIARAMGNIGNVHKSQGNYAQALDQHQRCLKTFEESGDRFGIAITLNNMAGTYGLQGNYKQELELYQKSLKISEEIGDRAGIARTLNNLANSYEEQGNYTLALEQYQKSLKISEEIGDKDGIADTLSNIGSTYRLQGDHAKALSFATRAADLASQIGNPDLIRLAQTRAGIDYFALGQLEPARRSFDTAIATIETLRAQVAGGEQEQQRFFETKVDPYQAMVELLIAQNSPGEALVYAERARARVLLDVLSSGRVSITKAMTGSEIAQERKFNGQLVSLNTQIYQEKLRDQPDRNRIDQLEALLRKARLDFEAFQTSLYAAHPELKVQRNEIRPVSLDDAAGLIPDARTALLDFVVTDDDVHLFVLTKDASGKAIVNTYNVKVDRKLLAEKVGRFRVRLANEDYDYRKLSQELYSLLLKPAEKQLQNKTNLIISPDNVLWDLPFQVLQPKEDHYLIEDAAISYAPSLTVLREMQLLHKKRRSQATASILALGNPELGKRSVELVKSMRMGTELQQLPEAGKQVFALGQLYGKEHSQVFTGPAAREEVVKQESARYRIFHLATHGILNNASPMYSHVMLAQTPGKSDEDGLLEAWEIMNLNLNADLAVLSACETARGRVGSGEGVIGLTWALFVAGCPTTVVSQWKVESSSTTTLMVEFHKRYKTRFDSPETAPSTAEAMRQASLKLMKDKQYQHPFYWGGFVVVGDGR